MRTFLLTIILLFITINVSAQTWGKCFSYAEGYIRNDSIFYGKEKKCDILISVSDDMDIIKIFSNNYQEYFPFAISLIDKDQFLLYCYSNYGIPTYLTFLIHGKNQYIYINSEEYNYYYIVKDIL